MSSRQTGYISPSEEQHLFVLLQEDHPTRRLRSMTVIIRDTEDGGYPDTCTVEEWDEWGFDVYVHMSARRGVDDNDESGFELNDGILNMDMWRRFGEVVGNSNTLEDFKFYVESVPEDRHAQLLAATRCVNAFFEEAKHNNSIIRPDIDLRGLQIHDVSHFIVNNKSLQDLTLHSEEPISLQDSNVLASAISNSSLEGIDIQGCNLDNNDGSFQRMLSGCSTCRLLSLLCVTNWHATALAAMLNNPATVVVTLFAAIPRCRRRLDYQQAARVITTSLEKNMHLQEIFFAQDFVLAPRIVSQIHMDIKKVLCNVSTINSIINSNHRVREFVICNHNWQDGNLTAIRNRNVEQVRQCLELNTNDNKAEVIRNKILRFYFVGEYDVSPLAKMPLSVLPEVISQIGGDHKHSAIYRLLRLIPELCNVSGRKSPGDEAARNKRRKV
jgi:hypothetical protein